MMQRQFTNNIQVLAYQIEKIGNISCGDSFYMLASDEYFVCTIADGLGSGEGAKDSSATVCEVVKKYQKEDIETIFNYCNQAMKNKRGATVSVLKVDFQRKLFTYSSVGNIRFVLYTPSGQYIYPIPVVGYLSGKKQKYRIQTFQYESGSKFIIYSDGLLAPTMKSLLKYCNTIDDIFRQLQVYVPLRKDDLTYIVGELC
ncbi:PP2C family serine/threonine-protein phosphatase [Bacillus alveayuensis]|uniref:Negative regulator of sigma-B (Phosphoserine phosphatase) n=1 Tax=Aeribacillus alveayuensis TaxID=279215 RepID=A0ABT9VRA3_9BACI|nr:PP2C family serine/threonine-protein phosphatase [Bacillus alveayuensis]MDQ0163488.1 negative regulator of sigma-B (phosphoserine phosphatase) [Bacillus alveayuensis]